MSTAWTISIVPTAGYVHPCGAAAATNYRSFGTVDIVHAVDIVYAARAVDIVHAIHTLDIAIVIVIVIAKAIAK